MRERHARFAWSSDGGTNPIVDQGVVSLDPAPHVRPSGQTPGQLPPALAQADVASRQRQRQRLNVAWPVTQMAWHCWPAAQPPPGHSLGAHGPRGGTVVDVVVVAPGRVVVVVSGRQPHSAPPEKTNAEQTAPAGHDPPLQTDGSPGIVPQSVLASAHWQNVPLSRRSPGSPGTPRQQRSRRRTAGSPRPRTGCPDPRCTRYRRRRSSSGSRSPSRRGRRTRSRCGRSDTATVRMRP